VSEQLSVRARFERFPATVKGAFILRGEDPEPHQVVFHEARVVAVAGGATQPVPVAATTLDVAPHQDVFVPFELLVIDLEPGWYGFECILEVDGIRSTYPGGRRFPVPWPRATVRRGQVRIDESVRLGERVTAHVEQLDCAGDSVRLSLTVEPPGPVTARLLADGTVLEPLESDVDEATGRARFTTYPLLRSHAALRIELKGRGRGASGSLDVRLP
jgi:hypothetical protein